MERYILFYCVFTILDATKGLLEYLPQDREIRSDKVIPYRGIIYTQSFLIYLSNMQSGKY
jgi:hypothetical protein